MKKIIIFSGILLSFILLTGCISELTPGSIVPCDNYYQITDLYKTPEPNYHIVLVHNIQESDGIRIPDTIDITCTGFCDKHIYNSLHNGDYIDNMFGLGIINKINMTSINESESGYRYACKVLP